jgi:monofunctional glycosyltransferase
MFLSRDKNFLRKGVEALITIKIEKTLTKKEILERYLNVVQFGKNIFGIKQAAQFYFKKHPSQLDANEAAFLAMVLPNPEKYSQSFYRKNLTKFARNRINRIVNNLHRFGRLDSLAYEEAIGNVDYFLKGEKAPTKEEEESDLALESELAAGDISDEDLEKLLDESKAESEKQHKPAEPIDTSEEELIEQAIEKERYNKYSQ